MSECTGSICDKKNDFQALLSNKEPVESPQHKHYLWMAHWTKASSSVEPQNGMISNRLKDANKGTSTKIMKSSVAERLMMGVSHGSASVQHAQQFNSDMWGVAHNVCKKSGQIGNEQCHQSFERSMKKKDVNLLARAVVSETYSICKFSELPVDFQKHGSSDNPNSDWSHFPMFEINRQIDNILNPKRRSALGPASLNVNMSTSHVMPSQEYRMHSHGTANENVDICKLAGGIVSHIKDPAGLSTDTSGQKLKRLISDTMSCSCIKDDNDSSNCLIDEQQTSHCFTNSKHNPPYASSGNKFKFAGAKKNKIFVDKQQDAEGIMFRAPVLGGEFQNEPINCSNIGKPDCIRKTHKSHGNIVSSSSLPYEWQHFKTCRMTSAEILKDSCMLPDPISNTSQTNSNGDPLAHGTNSTKRSTGSCKQKGPCLFETLTIPSKSQSAYPKNSVSSGKYSGLGFCMYGTNIGSHLFGAQNQSSAKTETLYSDTLLASKSLAGIASPSALKDYCGPNEAKTEQVTTPSMRRDSGHSKETGFSNVNEHQDVSSKATIASKQSYMPGTGTTNLDLILFQMSRMRNPISSGVVQPPVGAEPSDRWLKRLQLDISNPEIPSSKRSKVGGGPPFGETSCLFRMALHCNRSDNEEMIDHIKEHKLMDGVSKDEQEIPPVPAKSMNCWIGRWCQGGTPVLHEGRGQGRQARKLDQATEEVGGQFPSIAAMAMMGRVMNKLRPCEHQRKGPFVVWKTE